MHGKSGYPQRPATSRPPPSSERKSSRTNWRRSRRSRCQRRARPWACREPNDSPWLGCAASTARAHRERHQATIGSGHRQRATNWLTIGDGDIGSCSRQRRSAAAGCPTSSLRSWAPSSGAAHEQGLPRARSRQSGTRRQLAWNLPSGSRGGGCGRARRISRIRAARSCAGRCANSLTASG